VNWRDVRTGDIVRVEDDDPIPADIVVLNTSLPDGACYVETAELDG
jgi:phospholipid-translocating ATPase